MPTAGRAPCMGERGTVEGPPRAEESPEMQVARRLIEAGDAARRRVARDLHDGAQQQLVATVINLQRAQRKWDSDPAKGRELLDEALTRAQAGLRQLRDLVA